MEELVGLVVPIGFSTRLHHHLRVRNYHDDAASGRLSWLLDSGGRGNRCCCCPCVRLGLDQRQQATQETRRGEGASDTGSTEKRSLRQLPRQTCLDSRLSRLPSDLPSPSLMVFCAGQWARCGVGLPLSRVSTVLILGLSHGQYLQLPPEVLRSCTWQPGDAATTRTPASHWAGLHSGRDATLSTPLCCASGLAGAGLVHRAAPALARRRVGCPPPTVHRKSHRFEDAACCSQLSAPTHLSPPSHLTSTESPSLLTGNL